MYASDTVYMQRSYVAVDQDSIKTTYTVGTQNTILSTSSFRTLSYFHSMLPKLVRILNIIYFGPQCVMIDYIIVINYQLRIPSFSSSYFPFSHSEFNLAFIGVRRDTQDMIVIAFMQRGRLNQRRCGGDFPGYSPVRQRRKKRKARALSLLILILILININISLSPSLSALSSSLSFPSLNDIIISLRKYHHFLLDLLHHTSLSSAS